MFKFSLFKIREQDKHFLWSLYAAVSVILVWKGLWEGVYEIPYFSDYLGDPWVFLFIGFAMLTFSGIIFNEFDPLGGVEKAVGKTIAAIQKHPDKKNFRIKYFDKNQNKNLTIDAKYIRGVERQALIVKHPTKKQEMFIPFHRLKEVLYKDKLYWRL